MTKTERGTLRDFSTSFLSQNIKKLKGDTSGKIFFEKRVSVIEWWIATDIICKQVPVTLFEPNICASLRSRLILKDSNLHTQFIHQFTFIPQLFLLHSRVPRQHGAASRKPFDVILFIVTSCGTASVLDGCDHEPYDGLGQVVWSVSSCHDSKIFRLDFGVDTRDDAANSQGSFIVGGPWRRPCKYEGYQYFVLVIGWRGEDAIHGWISAQSPVGPKSLRIDQLMRWMLSKKENPW